MATKAENFAKLQDTLQKAGVDINEYNKAKASGASSADALKAGGYTGTTTNTGTTKTNTATQTSSGMNAVSQSSLDANKNKAQVGTGAVAGFNNTQQRTQELTNRVNQTQQEINNTKSQIAEKWGGLDYDTQQKKLNTINGLKEGLASKGITSKTQPTTQTTTTTPTKTTTTTKQTTPQQDRWDYQDNSQARMNQIADNLDKYRQTQPGLFEDASAFYNFFIDGKGRSQDQIDYLWDYFNRVQKFGKYDNLPASTIGDMLANGKLGDDYLNYLKTTDPAKYQEAISYRQDAEDTIKYESFLSDTADQAGLSGFEKFYKGIFGYRDENDDKIDDSLYIAPTEEEQTKQNRVNTIDSRIMEIKNMQKNLLDDLVEQYPGVPKATLMGIVQDRTKDLQREYDDLMVERTGLVGNIEYMQKERDMQSKARQSTINNLEKAYGMYYDYTAEGIAEMVQNKYAATNITLDQADQGTETQKQMALEEVLTPLYDKYGSIIQRSPTQVINDVIALSKKEGISLADAFEKNFMSQLRSKPQFATLSSGGTLGGAGTDKWDTVTITGADGKEKTVLYNQATGEVKNIDGTAYDGTVKTTAVGGATFKPVSKSAQTQALASVQSEYGVGSTYKNGWCGELANLYLQKMGSDIHLGDKIADKTKYITTKVGEGLPNVGDLVVRDFSSNPKASKVSQESGHVAVVTNVNKDGSFDVYQQNGDGKHTVGTAHIPNTNYVAGYIDPTAVSGGVGGAGGAGDYSSANYMDYETGVLNFIPIQLRNTEKEQEKIVTKIKSYYDRGLGQTEAALVQMGFNVQKATPEGKNVANRIVDMLSYVADEEAFDTTFMTMVSNDVNNGKYSEALKKTENMVYKYIQQSGQNAVSKTDIADAAVALSSLNKYKNNGNWLNNSTLTLKNIISAGGKKVEQFNVRQANLINTLEGLGYSEEMAQQLVPNLTMSRSAFVGKMDALQNLILDRYNRQRGEYGMPPVNLAVLLGNQSLSTAYGVNSEGEALQVF